MNTVLEKVRSALRIKHNNLDNELRDEIAACQIDLNLAGVEKTDPEDYLINEAIKLYCRAKHNFEGEGERYQKNYEKLKNALSLSSKYGGDTSEG